MTDDLRPYGSGGKLGWYWIKYTAGWIDGVSMGSGLRLIAIDELGNITRTRRRAEWDDDAPTEEEALLEHLSGAVAEAETHLERHKRLNARKSDEEPKPSEQPPSPATRRFLELD